MSSPSRLNEFFEKIQELRLARILQENRDLRSASSNVGEFKRNLSGIVSPIDPESIPKLVKLANEYQIPLYPYSCGKNWGYGSALPAKHHGVLLNLSSLNKIIKIDEVHGVAHIEPGVTQGQLSKALKDSGSKFHLDVTGSGADTSVVGNALERGVAYAGLRVDQVSGLKVVLGRGDVVETGFGGYENGTLKGLYPHGLGPSSKDLFFQSNFGVVIEAQIHLKPRPEKMVAVSLGLEQRDLPEAVETLRDLLKLGDLDGIPHIANKERTLSTLAPLVSKNTEIQLSEARKLIVDVIPGDWMVTAAISGSSKVVTAKIKSVQQKLKKYGRCHTRTLASQSTSEKLRERALHFLLSKNQRAVLESSRALSGFHLGESSNAGVGFLKGDGTLDVDNNPTGFLLCTPLAPLEGVSASRFVEKADSLAEKHRITHAITLNLVSHRVLEAVISAHFDRSNPDECERAHEYILNLNKVFSGSGFYPYRININEYGPNSPIPEELNRLNHEIKSVLDPKGIMAPGRYVYTPSNQEKAGRETQGTSNADTEQLSL